MQEFLSKRTIGERFKLLRLAKGNSQLVTSELFDLSRSNYSQIELGKQYPTYETLIRAARYYSKSYEWLLHGSDHVDFYRQSENSTVTDSYVPTVTTIGQKIENPLTKSTWVLINKDEKQRYIQNAFKEEYINQLPSYEMPMRLNDNLVFRAFTVDDHSMYPVLFENDIIIGIPINQYDEIIGGNIYIIVTKSNIFIKKISIYIPDKNIFICESNDPNHQSIVIEVSDVIQIWKVVSKFSTELFSVVEHLENELKKFGTTLSELQKKIEEINYKSSVS